MKLFATLFIATLLRGTLANAGQTEAQHTAQIEAEAARCSETLELMKKVGQGSAKPAAHPGWESYCPKVKAKTLGDPFLSKTCGSYGSRYQDYYLKVISACQKANLW